MLMSPVSVDPADVKQRLAEMEEEDEEDEELRAIRERLEGGGAATPGTPLHLRSGSDASGVTSATSTGARPKHVRGSSKRSSFCSDGGAGLGDATAAGGGGRWSPTAPWDIQAMDASQPENPEYAPMDYSKRYHSVGVGHHHSTSIVGSLTSASAIIPIPSASASSSAHPGRLSPASSGSFGVSHGTPNSCAGPPSERGDHHYNLRPEVETFESKAVSLLRPDDEDEDDADSSGHPPSSIALTDSKLPLRAYSVSSSTVRAPSSSSSSLSHHQHLPHGGRSRTSSVSRFIDVPHQRGGSGSSGSSTVAAAAAAARSSAAKLSASPFGGRGGFGGGGAVPTGQSPSLVSRLDSWFRSRAGSVPSRPQLSGRRRHRTQSEGEKDSPENQEEAEATAAAAEAKAVAAAAAAGGIAGGGGGGGGSGRGSGENSKG